MDESGRETTISERRADLPAWLLSVVLHATLFIAIGLLAPVTSRPSPGEAPRAVGIALVANASSATPEYFSAGEAGSPASGTVDAETAEANSQTVTPLPDPGQFSAAGTIQLPTATGGGAAAAGLGATLDAGGLTRGGTNSGRGGVGGKTGTQIFGARGEGNRFVYVFDRSSSMGGFNGRPLAAAKRELRRSLQDLVSGNQFQIVFYNERQTVFNPFAPNPPAMLFATEENRQLAEQYVRQVDAVGSTRHLDALDIALRMGPDVIFFLTDAAEPALSARELSEVRRRNRSAAVIHAIEFGPGPFQGGDNFLMRIARQNQGQHIYVDVTTLPEKEAEDAAP